MKPGDVVNTLKESGYVEDQVLSAITEGLECYNSIASSLGDKSSEPTSNACLIAAKAGVSSSLERDFTTANGTQGSLRCPFAKSNNKTTENGTSNGVEDPLKLPNGGTCGHEDLDPIKTELNDRRSSQAGSATSSYGRCPTARCPIRFLDKHSPEEVAEFIEKHKHDLPRSHTICVKRYQRNSESMRKLDAKYGSLINMVRGLGEKHQAFLPGNNVQNGAPTASGSTERVEKWAEDFSSRTAEQQINPAVEKDVTEDGDERKGHFDRPLREVRVGESPSRPWGIHVPLNYQRAVSPPWSPAAPVPFSGDQQVNNLPDQPPAEASTTTPPAPKAPTGRCPFGHGAGQRDSKNALETEKVQSQKETTNVADAVEKNAGDRTVPKDETVNTNPNPAPPPANIVFNGPVFFGYSAEQTASFLQQLGAVLNKP